MEISRPDVGTNVEPNVSDAIADLAAPALDRWFAAIVACAIVLLAVAVWPVGHQKTIAISAYMPTMTCASIVAFMLTASLLYAQYRAGRRPAPGILALAYAAAAMLLLEYMLTYPGIFSVGGLLGAGPQTALWLHISWHILFCSIAIFYAMVERKGAARLPGAAPGWAGSIVLATVAVITGLVTVGQQLLPQVVADGSYTAFYRATLLPVILISTFAALAAMVGWTRLRTRGHLWLSLVLLAIFVDTIISAFASGGRYDFGWYFARGELAVSTTALLVMLHIHYASNLQRMADANRCLQAHNAQVQAFISLQDEITAALPSRPAVIKLILDFAQHQTGANAGVFEMPDGDEMVYEAATGTLAPFVGARMPRAGSLTGQCADVGAILMCDDTSTDTRVNGAACRRFNISSMVVVPITLSPTITAVIKVASPRTFAFGAAEIQTLQLAAKNLASSLAAAHEFATLEQSERRYRGLTEAMPQLVGIVQPGLGLIYTNERTRLFTGQSTALLNADVMRIIYPGDEHQLANVATTIECRNNFECELRLRRADGDYRWHALRVIALEQAQGDPMRWLLTATDVEERKLSECIIAESAAQLAAAAQTDRALAVSFGEANRLLVMAEEMAHVGHYRLDLISNALYWSDDVYRTFGQPKTFVPTLATAVHAFDGDDHERISAMFTKSWTQGLTFAFESRIIRPDGTARNIVASGQVERSADGEIVAVVGIIHDVTDTKDSERERERLSERVVLATKAGKIGIWQWNINADSLEWDSAMFALYAIEDAGDDTLFDLCLRRVHPADRERFLSELALVANGNGVLDTEYRVIWPSGAVHYLRATGTLRNNPAGDGVHVIGTNWDITEFRLLTEDLREQKERAQEASRAKSDFLARMSHEIRTPMNGIIGFTTLVLDGTLQPEQRRFMMLLHDAGRALLTIINDILDFSKIEAGKLELEQIPFDLNAIVDGALAIVRMEAQPKGIAVSVHSAPDILGWVHGDPTRLRQIFLNLLTNALKFTDIGSITLIIQRDPLRADYLRFECTDTGIGIAAEQQHLLFGEFSQIDRSTARRYAGTGLGLAIAQRLVQAMGGTIGVQSSLGAGSTFWFTARLQAVAAPALRVVEEVAAPGLSRRILVADDNRVNQIVVENLLVRDGHAVVVVENGAQAVEAIRSGRFDLVLMDMQMPVMDGVDATRTIRALGLAVSDIPIVAITANAMPHDIRRCHAAGMNDHLAKPIDRTLLRRAIAQWTSIVPDTAHKESEPVSQPASEATPSLQDADTPTIGFATLLEIFDGDRAAVVEILSGALASIEVDLGRIEHSLATQDMPAAVEAAHRMKGTSGSIGSQRVLALSTQIEQSAKKNPPEMEAQSLLALSAAVSEFRHDLQALCEPVRLPSAV